MKAKGYDRHMTSKALFLDRDGVLIEDTAYPFKRKDLVIRESVLPLLKEAIRREYRLVILTNQSGIARGYFTEEQYFRFQDWMFREFRNRGIEFQGSYFCPYLEDAPLPEYRRKSEDRKPEPGMVYKAHRDLGIDPAESIMVGDKESDLIRLPGLRCFLIQGKYPVESKEFLYTDEESIMRKLGWI